MLNQLRSVSADIEGTMAKYYVAQLLIDQCYN